MCLLSITLSADIGCQVVRFWGVTSYTWIFSSLAVSAPNSLFCSRVSCLTKMPLRMFFCDIKTNGELRMDEPGRRNGCLSGEPDFLGCTAVSLCREVVDLASAGAAGVRIGYCPQQDALDELLTGWEHLQYYCCLRGIPKLSIPHVRLPGLFQKRVPLRNPWSTPPVPTELSDPLGRNHDKPHNVPERCFQSDYTEGNPVTVLMWHLIPYLK